MSCYGCACNFCAYSAELPSWYLTVGEVESADEICFSCSDCKYYDERKNKNNWKSKCEKRKLACKYIDAERQRMEHIAQSKRANFTVIKRGK